MVGLVVDFGRADILQLPDRLGGWGSDVALSLSVADNFAVLNQNIQISNISWWGGYFPFNTPPVVDSFTIRIHQDDSGLPDGFAEILDMFDIAPERVDTGVDLFYVDEYFYSIDVEGLNLSPGIYWLEIYNNTSLEKNEWFWESASLDKEFGLAGMAIAAQTPGVEWFEPASYNYELAFKLTTVSVPEPYSGILLIVAMMFICAERRRIQTN